MSSVSDPATWVAQHGDALFRYALMKMRDEAQAEDMVQETFLAALKARERFSGQSSEKTWLIGILKHKIIDHFRKYKREQSSDDIESLTEQLNQQFDHTGHWSIPMRTWQEPEQAHENKEFWKVFAACIAHLPDHLADLFILREVKGLSSEEICKLLDISTTNNMWVMLSRARMRLRGCLDSRWFNRSNDDQNQEAR
ncbi:MAG: sigma-70 family RNA polymerase sigma factor [Gammaproteobacteria bacterium]|nr:sigma-70 family RNA polymerase sigma factor [Gammaproteobacteria bacterium]